MRIIAGWVIVLSFMTVSSAFSAEISMSGLIQTWWAAGSQEENTTDIEREFLTRRARIGLKAKVNDLITGKLQTDGIPDVKMIDAELVLQAHPWANVRVGRMKYDLDVEGRASVNALSFPTRPVATRVIADRISDGGFRLEGIEVLGSGDLGEAKAGYAVGIFNGRSKSSDKDNEAILLNLHATVIETLKINLGFITEKTGETATGDTQDTVWTGGIRYTRGGLVVGGEYYSLEIETGGTTVSEPSGYYGFATYRMGMWEVGGRYQFYDTDIDAEGDISSVDLKATAYLGDSKGYHGPKITLLYEIRSADDGYNYTDGSPANGFSGSGGGKTYDEKGTNVGGDNIDNVIILELAIPL